MDRIIVALRTFLTLALPYFRSEDRWRARLLLAGVIGAELGLVYVAVSVIQWNARFFNALEARDWDGFKRELFVFGFITLGAIFLNDFMGATRFYDANIYGQSSIVANIEGGFVWPGHVAFDNGQVTQFLIDPANTTFPLPGYVDHATGVGSILSGLGPLIISNGSIGYSKLNFGMAPLSQLWTGAALPDASLRSCEVKVSPAMITLQAMTELLHLG